MLPPNLPHISQAPIWVPNPRQLMFESGKLQALDRLLQQLKTGNHRVLLYFQMTKMIDLMEEYLAFRHYTYLRLDGSSKISDRRDMVMDWQTRSDIFIFLLSTRAGGLGINLTAADTVVFYDSDWNPTVDQQAMDRAHRLGQTRQVTVYRLITRGTIEERILQRAMEKDEIQKVVISGGAFNQEVKNENDPGTEVKAAPMPVDSAADMEIDPLPIRK
jgi:DNA helicase INO80